MDAIQKYALKPECICVEMTESGYMAVSYTHLDVYKRQVVQDTDQSDPDTEETKNITELIFAGDVCLSGYVTANYDKAGISGVLEDGLLLTMQQADICMVNEEFPFGTGGTQAEDKQYTFRTDPSYSSIFTDMGIDIVTLANNHVLDYGQEVLRQTSVSYTHLFRLQPWCFQWLRPAHGSHYIQQVF